MRNKVSDMYQEMGISEKVFRVGEKLEGALKDRFKSFDDNRCSLSF